jgi:hypothetical protein
MYRVDEQDGVVEVGDVPQSSVGAPLPVVLADEHRVVLAYHLDTAPQDWDGSSVRMVDPVGSDEPIAIVQFERCTAHMFGPPNDEAFSGHPLAARGLTPYGVFEVTDSSWIRTLERMNSVHPGHDAKRFLAGRRHFVFAFHDSTFECICAGFQIHLAQGSLRSVISRMTELLD